MALNPAADFYDNLGIRYEQSFGHDAGLISFVQSGLDLLAPQSTVLELGCGTGKPISSMVVEAGHRLHGIDFSSVMIELSRRQVPQGDFELVNMLEFSPKTGPYDAAIAVFSLFHFSRGEMSTVASKFGEWVRPGGYLFIGTMVAEDFQTKADQFDADGQCARGIEHTFMGKRIGNLLYTREGWKNLLEANGFQVVKTEMVPFQAPPEAECDSEPHYYITARKVA